MKWTTIVNEDNGITIVNIGKMLGMVWSFFFRLMRAENDSVES